MTRSKLVAFVYRIVICEKRNKSLSELTLTIIFLRRHKTVTEGDCAQ